MNGVQPSRASGCTVRVGDVRILTANAIPLGGRGDARRQCVRQPRWFLSICRRPPSTALGSRQSTALISYFGMSERFSRRLVRRAFQLFTSSTVPGPANCSRREHQAGRYSRRWRQRKMSLLSESAPQMPLRGPICMRGCKRSVPGGSSWPGSRQSIVSRRRVVVRCGWAMQSTLLKTDTARGLMSRVRPMTSSPWKARR